MISCKSSRPLQFHFIYISCKTSSLKSFTSTLIELRFTKAEREKYTKLMLSCTKNFNHILIDGKLHASMSFKHAINYMFFSFYSLVEKRTVRITTVGEKTPLELILEEQNSDAQRARLSAAPILQLLPNPSAVAVIFELLVSKLKRIDATDLTIQLTSSSSEKGKKGTKKTTIKLIDYLFSLQTPDHVPDPILIRAHKFFLSRGINIPCCLISNKHFLPPNSDHPKHSVPSIPPSSST